MNENFTLNAAVSQDMKEGQEDLSVSESTEEVTPEQGAGSGVSAGPEPTEQGPEPYPLRKPSEDPRWAVGIVWTWVGIAIFLLLFIVALIILGFWYD